MIILLSEHQQKKNNKTKTYHSLPMRSTMWLRPGISSVLHRQRKILNFSSPLVLGSTIPPLPSTLVLQTRGKADTPRNVGIMFVPQQEAWLVERMGKFNAVLEPGLNFLIPILDKVKYVQSLKEIAIDIPQQSAISLDNVALNIDGVLYLRIMDPYKASYGIEDPEFAITQLAQTTMRSEIGKISLDMLFKERENLNIQIVRAINAASEAWGIQSMRYEIRDIRLPERVQEAMQMQVEAERKKRAAILESEGIKAADINIAEGKKQSAILKSEAEKAQLINEAEGAARAVVVAGEARAESLRAVAGALTDSQGSGAASLAVAENYVKAFGNLAKETNTLLLPANAGDVTGMVTQALSIYKQLDKTVQSEVLESGASKPSPSPTKPNTTSHNQTD